MMENTILTTAHAALPWIMVSLLCLVIALQILFRRREVNTGEVGLSALNDALNRQQEIADTRMRSEAERMREGVDRSHGILRQEVNQTLREGTEGVMQTLHTAAANQNQRLDAFAKLSSDAASSLRQEVSRGLDRVGQQLADNLVQHGASQGQHLQTFAGKLQELTKTQLDASSALRHEVSNAHNTFAEQLTGVGERLKFTLQSGITEMTGCLEKLTAANAAKLEALKEALAQGTDNLKESVAQGLNRLREENGQHLEQMRKTVDEKLQGTLEKRLGQSFSLVSERLEQVHRNLGEMQTLTRGVGDLKKVLTNVKTRGTWGEVQLGALLEQILTPDQYEANVRTRMDSGSIVEYAIKLPGHGRDASQHVWLPIDAKFPKEDYERLVEASEQGDSAALDLAARQLEARVKGAARDIRDKYLDPPHTTDFGIMFLATEGLYAEVLRRPGLMEALQHTFRVVVAGPSTLAALLNSLQMGFRTLAIQKRSSEVWELLGAVKTEFDKFGGVMEKVQKKLQEASSVVEQVGVRRRAMARKLRSVEAMPALGAIELLSGHTEETDPTTDAMAS